MNLRVHKLREIWGQEEGMAEAATRQAKDKQPPRGDLAFLLEMSDASLLFCPQSPPAISQVERTLDVRRSGLSSKLCHQQVTFQYSHLCLCPNRARGWHNLGKLSGSAGVRILGNTSLLPNPA